MTDYEYILQDAKLFHYKGWEVGELRKCIDIRQELRHRYNDDFGDFMKRERWRII